MSRRYASLLTRPAFIAVCFLSVITGCRRVSESAIAAVPQSGWSAGDSKDILYNNSDTTSFKNIVLFLSHEKNMVAERTVIDFDITVLTPDSLSYTESFHFSPSYTEKSSSDYFVSGATYRSNVTLNKCGNYIFTISHNETTPLKGIRAIGLEMKSN